MVVLRPVRFSKVRKYETSPVTWGLSPTNCFRTVPGDDCNSRPKSWADAEGMHSMSDERAEGERPCLHCMIVELIDDFFAEYPATAGSDKIDTSEADEVIDAI